MDSKVSEKDMREVYFQAFGKEYDSADRKQAPLPLEIAYLTALNKLKREGKYAGGGEITDDAYYQSVNHFVYFCMNYQNDFLDAFGSLKTHLSNKFKDYYNRFGSYGVMIKFYTELDGKNRRILTDYSLKNYKGTPISSDVSEIEYFNSVNHFIFFCFNFPPNFMDAFSSHLKVHLSSKWTSAYERKGSIGAMIFFWSELDGENRRKLATWSKNNYTGTKLYEVGGALGDVAGMLPSPLPMSTIQAMADGGQLELFADGGGVKSDYYIFEGMDNLKGNPLYRVERTSESDNEYVGEWHTDKSDAEKELKSFYSDGGGVDVDLEDDFKKALVTSNFTYYTDGSDGIRMFRNSDNEELTDSAFAENSLSEDIENNDIVWASEDMKYNIDAMREQFSLGGLLLGAGAGVLAYKLYLDYKKDKEKKRLQDWIDGEKKYSHKKTKSNKDIDDNFQEEEERASRKKNKRF